ncbi:SGNH/GDSL hydrolase family protein [Candidatus Gottesmanbacteria bacterium]|nr:SGNH/GDSL hydrolase family protein [Candidatus Gottesmanbacteria bacterium]
MTRVAAIVARSLLFAISCLLSAIFGILAYRFVVLRVEPRIIRLKRDRYIFSRIGSFKHFYEPKANTITEDNPGEGLSFTGTATINADSLNDRYNYSIEKPDGTYRIVTMGDSFTYGLFVNTQDNYSEQLEDKLNANLCPGVNHYEVINLGVSGYDVGFSTERFRLRGQKYNPDLVIWFMNPHNFSTYQDYQITLEDKYFKKMSDEELRKREAKGEWFYWWARASTETINAYGPDRIMAQQATYLTDFASYYNGPLVLALNQPDQWSPYEQWIVKNYQFSHPDVRLFSGLPKLSRDETFFPDIHPNIKGHKLIATSLYSYLTTEHLLGCSN